LSTVQSVLLLLLFCRLRFAVCVCSMRVFFPFAFACLLYSTLPVHSLNMCSLSIYYFCRTYNKQRTRTKSSHTTNHQQTNNRYRGYILLPLYSKVNQPPPPSKKKKNITTTHRAFLRGCCCGRISVVKMLPAFRSTKSSMHFGRQNPAYGKRNVFVTFFFLGI